MRVQAIPDTCEYHDPSAVARWCEDRFEGELVGHVFKPGRAVYVVMRERPFTLIHVSGPRDIRWESWLDLRKARKKAAEQNRIRRK